MGPILSGGDHSRFQYQGMVVNAFLWLLCLGNTCCSMGQLYHWPTGIPSPLSRLLTFRFPKIPLNHQSSSICFHGSEVWSLMVWSHTNSSSTLEPRFPIFLNPF